MAINQSIITLAIKALIILAFQISTSACTIVKISGAHRVTTHLGVLRIEPSPGADLIAIRTRGFGIIQGVEGLTIGYQRENVALIYDGSRCQIILFENHGANDRQPMSVAGAAEFRNICSVGVEHETN